MRGQFNIAGIAVDAIETRLGGSANCHNVVVDLV